MAKQIAMDEHTAGPWNAPLLNGETTGLVWAGEPYGGVIASVHQLAKKDFGTTTANALLIAAAPEMLEALEWILNEDWNDGPGSWTHVRERIESVIAKTQGGTP